MLKCEGQRGEVIGIVVHDIKLPKELVKNYVIEKHAEKRWSYYVLLIVDVIKYIMSHKNDFVIY